MREGSGTLGCFLYLFRRDRIESAGGVVFGLCDAEPVTGGKSKELGPLEGSLSSRKVVLALGMVLYWNSH